MIIRKWIDVGAPLTPEQLERLKLLDDIKDEDIIFDEDCPELTPEQLKEFRRVNPRRRDRQPIKN